MRPLVITAVVIVLIASVFGIVWAGANGFGTRQAVEFFPYDEQIDLGDGRTIRSSGVVVRLNQWEVAPTDQELAGLMVATRRMYPIECSGENWEIAIRRPSPDGWEEKYSYMFSIYETGEPTSRIEYGRWVDDQYVVEQSYRAEWSAIAEISNGTEVFQVRVE